MKSFKIIGTFCISIFVSFCCAHDRQPLLTNRTGRNIYIKIMYDTLDEIIWYPIELSPLASLRLTTDNRTTTYSLINNPNFIISVEDGFETVIAERMIDFNTLENKNYDICFDEKEGCFIRDEDDVFK